MGHARALAGVSDVSLQIDLLKQILAQDLSVRAVEGLIARQQAASSPKAPKEAPLSGSIKKYSGSVQQFLWYQNGTETRCKRERSTHHQV